MDRKVQSWIPTVVLFMYQMSGSMYLTPVAWQVRKEEGSSEAYAKIV